MNKGGLQVFQGCGASVLLDDTPSFVGEKTASPNLNSLRGFEVIDGIKSDLESICPPKTVSCADILATVARDSVTLVCDVSNFHSPPEECELAVWCNVDQVGQVVQMGRRDSLTASITAANKDIPEPNSSMATLVTKFQNVDLTLNDMVTLSGAHTMGKARCSTFSSRLNSLQQLCSESNSDTTLAHLDLVTPSTFDNQYYVNLISGEGLFSSDQILVTGDD
ncbi:hypothetical protein HYC85_006385 [Camellia sinensis]|uniref:peroxidase n=1 Tax=Camellia sinensis TaxID=4442 RepID=A0A7J7HLD9_CAMSI|nr:hypothetical protein HYC85_006385 [Camellia sinensis]